MESESKDDIWREKQENWLLDDTQNRQKSEQIQKIRDIEEAQSLK